MSLPDVFLHYFIFNHLSTVLYLSIHVFPYILSYFNNWYSLENYLFAVSFQAAAPDLQVVLFYLPAVHPGSPSNSCLHVGF